jgi:hypothetical protein
LAVNRHNTLLHRNSQRHVLIRDKAVYELDIGIRVREMVAVPWANEGIVRMLRTCSRQAINEILKIIDCAAGILRIFE